MPNVGLKYFVYALIKETPPPNAAVEYEKGKVLAEAISANINITISDVKLYADDKVSESIKEFQEGTFTAVANHFSPEDLGVLLGHKVTTDNGAVFITASESDNGKEVGIGFFSTSILHGEKGYRAIWLRKVKFGIPNETLQTKGASTTFQTPSIEATIMADALGKWKEEGWFKTEEESRKWLEEKADIDETL